MQVVFVHLAVQDGHGLKAVGELLANAQGRQAAFLTGMRLGAHQDSALAVLAAHAITANAITANAITVAANFGQDGPQARFRLTASVNASGIDAVIVDRIMIGLEKALDHLRGHVLVHHGRRLRPRKRHGSEIEAGNHWSPHFFLPPSCFDSSSTVQ